MEQMPLGCRGKAFSRPPKAFPLRGRWREAPDEVSPVPSSINGYVPPEARTHYGTRDFAPPGMRRHGETSLFIFLSSSHRPSAAVTSEIHCDSDSPA